MTIIQDFIYAANVIKYYENTSKNIFRHAIARYKKIELSKKLDKFKNFSVDKELIIEFISIYNGSYDIIQIDTLSAYISNTNVYTLKMEVNQKIIYVSTIGPDSTNDVIFITYMIDGLEKKIRIQKSFDQATNDKDISDTINDVLITYIKMYINEYINM